MSDNYNAFDHKAWDEAGLKDFGDFSDMIEYVNQRDIGDQLEGGWWYADDEKKTIYTGTFGNYNSPGASSYTNADVYDDEDEYKAEVAKLEAMPEYVETDDDEEDEEEDDEDDDTACAYCGGTCPDEPEDSENLCDGFAGDIDNLYGDKDERTESKGE